MRVGVVTFHRVPNFGAVLQAWSMAYNLRELGADVEILDYRAPGNEAMFKRHGFKALVPSIGAARQKRFVRKNVPLSKVLYSLKDVEDYVSRAGFDVLACGSDQIWKKDHRLGFDPVYYLGFNVPSGVRRISYAPSCGDMTGYGEHSANAMDCFNRFYRLSVRDGNSMEVLHRLGLRNVKRVVDPTLLADFSSILRKRSDNTPYLAVVGGLDDASVRLVREVAAALRLRIIAAGTRCTAAHIEKRFVSPEEWLSLIANAHFVVTSLFHGSALALKYRRPFISLDCAGRRTKLQDLLDHFGLQSRLAAKSGDDYVFSDELLHLDYSQYESSIESALADSREFLKEAIYG